jgi:hypothetical protein
MTLFGITLAFAMLLAALGSAMIIHSILGKRRIASDFRRVSEPIGGAVSQATVFSFPQIAGRYDGRDASVFFHLAKGEKASIIYLVYTISVKSTMGLFLAKDKYFKPVNDPTKLSRAAGDVVPGLDTRYQVHASDQERARQLFARNGFRDHLNGLEAFPSLVLGPDSLVVGKPFEGAEDTQPETMLKHVRALGKIATELEAIA